MSHDRDRPRNESAQKAAREAEFRTPGKATLVQMLQRRAAAPEGMTPGKTSLVDIHQTAERGVSGSPGTLPHIDAIQRSFGRHDVGGVRSFVGGEAANGA